MRTTLKRIVHRRYSKRFAHLKGQATLLLSPLVRGCYDKEYCVYTISADAWSAPSLSSRLESLEETTTGTDTYFKNGPSSSPIDLLWAARRSIEFVSIIGVNLSLRKVRILQRAHHFPQKAPICTPSSLLVASRGSYHATRASQSTQHSAQDANACWWTSWLAVNGSFLSELGTHFCSRTVASSSHLTLYIRDRFDDAGRAVLVFILGCSDSRTQSVGQPSVGTQPNRATRKKSQSVSLYCMLLTFT